MNFSAASCGVSEEGEEKEAQLAARNCPTLLGLDSDAAQDAIQETYLRVLTRLESYQPTGNFSEWITRVAINEALMIRLRLRGDTISFDEACDDALSVE